MDFFIKITKNKLLNLRQRYLGSFDDVPFEEGVLYIERLKHLDYLESDPVYEQWLIGDVIKHDQNDRVGDKGFYYNIRYHADERKLIIKPDLHSFLPIYYVETEDCWWISSSISAIAARLTGKTINSQFITEMALFNVPLGSSTFLKEINRLLYGEYLVIDPTGITKLTQSRFYDYFSDSPTPYRKAINNVIDSFNFNCIKYFNTSSNISLTGGFDGRAIVGVAHSVSTDYQTYSYGKPENGDVRIPKLLSHNLSFPYRYFEVGDKILPSEYIKTVNEFLKFSGGMNGFLYPLPLYSAHQVSRDNRAVITGYCGSELLRNAHFGGAVTSQVAIDLLRGGIDFSLDRVRNITDYRILGDEYVSDELTQISVEKCMDFFNNLPSSLTKNQKLAVFEFEEVLPKLFGIWTYAAMHYSRIRIPFMDISFLTEIMKTRVTQVYREFMEQNPFKRYYGQILYAEVIQRTWPELGRFTSSKGYAPHDLLTIPGKFKTVYMYLGKKRRKDKTRCDNLGLISGMKMYYKHKPDRQINTVVNNGLIQRIMTNQLERDNFFLKLSAQEYKKIVFNLNVFDIDQRKHTHY